MSWPLAEAWAIVAGSLLLTAGTGAQAWANITEYRDLQQVVAPAASQALLAALKGPVLTDVRDLMFSGSRFALTKFAWRLLRAIKAAIFEIPARMTTLRKTGPEDAARLAQLLRLAAAWSVILAGSALVLVGAVIHLALAYAE
jgi:hypothetical protein